MERDEETVLTSIAGPTGHCRSWCVLLALRCSLMRDQNIERSFVADFPRCRSPERFFVNWKWNMSVFGKRLCLSKHIHVDSFCAQLQAGNSLQEPSELPIPLFLQCKETAWESTAVQLFHMEEKWPALSTCRQFPSMPDRSPSQMASRWYFCRAPSSRRFQNRSCSSVWVTTALHSRQEA